MKQEIKELIRVDIKEKIDDIMRVNGIESASFSYKWEHECGGLNDDGDSYCWHESQVDELHLDDWTN